MEVGLLDILQLLQGVKKSGGSYMAKCPAHDDKNASLSITEGEAGRVLFHCHAGCDTQNIAVALGLSMTDLMGSEKRELTAQRRIVATYDYADEKSVGRGRRFV